MMFPANDTSIDGWDVPVRYVSHNHLQMIFPIKPPFIMDFPVRYVSHYHSYTIAMATVGFIVFPMAMAIPKAELIFSWRPSG